MRGGSLAAAQPALRSGRADEAQEGVLRRRRRKTPALRVLRTNLRQKSIDRSLQARNPCALKGGTIGGQLVATTLYASRPTPPAPSSV